MKTDLKICTIGGGSGMPIVNRSLVKAGFKNIKSIVTTFDSGGDSGRLRTDERGKVLAFSDYWRALISLWSDGKQKDLWQEMLRYRDGRGRNFGNTFFQFLSEKEGDLSKVDSLFSSLTQAKLSGEVIPVSLKPANICFQTMSGKKYIGEHNLDDLRMSLDKVIKVWLEPKVKVNKEVIDVLINSDVIIVCPGSMYGSVLTNFLPKGMINGYKKSKAKKILMTNIVSVANENKGYDQCDYIEIFKNYLKTEKPFDYVVMSDLGLLDKNQLKKVLKSYGLEHSSPIKYNKDCLCKTLLVDLAIIEEKNMRLRHCEEKLAKFFDEFVC